MYLDIKPESQTQHKSITSHDENFTTILIEFLTCT